MTQKRVAIYAGSFDPPTNGHIWMITQAAQLFDHVIIAIGTNPDKTYAFSLSTRIDLLETLVKVIPNVHIESFAYDYLVHYAKDRGATHIVRGIRNSDDYRYERMMRHINHDIDKTIETIFLMPPRNLAEISSSLVRGLIGPHGWEKVIRQYVPENVFQELRKISQTTN